MFHTAHSCPRKCGRQGRIRARRGREGVCYCSGWPKLRGGPLAALSHGGAFALITPSRHHSGRAPSRRFRGRCAFVPRMCSANVSAGSRAGYLRCQVGSRPFRGAADEWLVRGLRCRSGL